MDYFLNVALVTPVDGEDLVEGQSFDASGIEIALRVIVRFFSQIFSYIKVFFFLITDTLGLLMDLFNAFFYLIGF